MAIKSESPQEARERLLRQSEIEREGTKDIASGQAHEQFVKDNQELAVALTDASAPLDELEMERRTLGEKANADVILAERAEAGGESGGEKRTTSNRKAGASAPAPAPKQPANG